LHSIVQFCTDIVPEIFSFVLGCFASTVKNMGLSFYWTHNCRFASTSESYAALEDSFRL